MEGLGINVPTIIAQLINFFLLLGLLYLVAYKPILKIFDERSNKIKESMELADGIKEQAEKAEEEAKKRIDAAGKEGQESIARAVKMAEEIKEQAKEAAKPEADALITRARQEIKRERDEAIDGLRKEVADLTIIAAEKVIEQTLDKEAHRQIIERVLDESDALKKS